MRTDKDVMEEATGDADADPDAQPNDDKSDIEIK
jgi:hypothetical protein